MALQKHVRGTDVLLDNKKSLSVVDKTNEKAHPADTQARKLEADVDTDLREIYFLIMHFLSAGPCQKTCTQFWNELQENRLLPRRYHAWYSRSGRNSGEEDDDGMSLPMTYVKLIERYPHIAKDHLVKLLKQLISNTASPARNLFGGNVLNAADVPTLLGTGSFSLVGGQQNKVNHEVSLPGFLRWPHMMADQVRGLSLREIGGGFSRHHRAPSVRAACYAIVKPSTMVEKMQTIKTVRGHCHPVYCATFDRSGRFVITGSDDKLVKIWSMETAYCLASCRGHKGDITDLAVNFNNTLVASASNDTTIRVWRLNDGYPISVLQGHTDSVTAIAFSPRPGALFQLLSTSDDGTCRIWDARHSNFSPRLYVPKPSESVAGRNNGPSATTAISCCAFNSSGTVFVTGSADKLARVWNACKSNAEESGPNHEMDVLAGHEDDVNYVQFSGCALTSRLFVLDASKEENLPKFKNTWYNQDNIVTCSRDGSAIIWIPKSRRSHGKVGRWTRAYHLKVPPPPMPPQPPRGGPRQRILPTPRGVNMIIWSLDNRFVLAAIMDCRICVWNAADGSLVHSLTGHTDQTYVLDVHPFNPRMAMSAGYDGRTIIWDIWEGIPIRTFEIGRFKLVDGKFSPDGTSIILSDDVGQLYILSTGQGESQMDAKYEQFFLGDYRPLVQDAHGNVLDQETQLVPFRRNMQDLLCDSGLIPYPEPYQSMYQKRRHGILGIEWRPSSVNFVIGHDISLGEGGTIIPMIDLDIPVDPLPEFLDAMDWEPEIEIQSDDDSEYHVTEENSSGGEQESSFSRSPNSESSGNDSGEESSHRDRRRSKRKKQKAEIEVTTSSGRRVKRKNLDDYGDRSQVNNRCRKSKSGNKSSRKKSSSLKSGRPRRAAARNALHLFSRITGTSTDADGEHSTEGDSSDSDALSNISEESDPSLIEEHQENVKGKGVLIDHTEDLDNKIDRCSESHVEAGTRRKLILKFPNRDSGKFAGGSKNGVAGPSFTPRMHADRMATSTDANSTEMDKSRMCLDLLEGSKDGNVCWGGVKTRTSKRSKIGESQSVIVLAGSNIVVDGNDRKVNSDGGRNENESGLISLRPHVQNEGAAAETVDMNKYQGSMSTSSNLEAAVDEGPNSFLIEHEPSYELVMDGRSVLPMLDTNGNDNSLQSLEKSFTAPKRLRIKSRIFSDDHVNSGKIGNQPLLEDSRHVPGGTSGSQDNGCDLKSGVFINGWKGTSNVENGSHDHNQESNSLIDTSSGAALPDLQQLPPQNRTFGAVYRRSKSLRRRGNQEDENENIGISGSVTGEDSLHDRKEELTEGIRLTRSVQSRSSAIEEQNLKDGDVSAQLEGVRRTRSIRLRSKTHDSNQEAVGGSGDTAPGAETTSRDEDISPRTDMTISRSSRNRKPSYHVREASPVDNRRKSNQLTKSSWLMLSTLEEGSRYIPQLGDDVVYLRQGHEEYITQSKLKESGPWNTLKGEIRAVEFCKVEELAYSTRPGSGESCCKMLLRFVDPASSVVGESFRLTLPEVTTFPDFLVERSRYDAAVSRKWTSRDKCQVWWQNDGGEVGGTWWDGRITSVKPKSSDFPDSPWERYVVQYKSDPRETHQHSPWELYNADTHWEQPHIDAGIRHRLLSAFAKLDKSVNKKDNYGLQKLREVSQKTSFANRFPVPLSFEVIHSRLENNYYRSLDAMKHDFQVMLSNAESYFARSSDCLAKIGRLSDWFAQLTSSL
ncbi:OLC1v1020632C1 [Oldenlandia corymbosa var. corymbosa]|uniref:OLC1v1020632C1 n=1 Tax=Oldenlandia corymbosa var. corymbosa TaxID=529605 RepID=A0AAV1EGW1_OLDCO|nr:OLC1v1020632C1 [Oldenlandia corymbosa var. corymbosa]